MDSQLITFGALEPLFKSGVLGFSDTNKIESLLDLISERDPDREELEPLLTEILESVDWPKHADEIGQLASRLLPIETLLPQAYEDWKPIVRESFAYVVSHLSASRIVPKLVEQIIDCDEPLEKRIIAFISEMPTLQKLGQIIARNRNLDTDFRAELIRLENGIEDADPQTVFDTLRQELGPKIDTYSIDFEEVLHSEASVGAVVRFTFYDQNEKQYREGVFKVLKQNVVGHFWEEISILDGLVKHLHRHRKFEALRQVDLHSIIDDVRQHLVPELDFRNEQSHLLKAKAFFSQTPNLRIPTLLPALCANCITAMSFEPGTKITEAFADNPYKRRQAAELLIDVFIAHPLLDGEGATLLHADPHAGNLFLDEATGELILLDWALIEELDHDSRRQMLLFVTGLALRDPQIATDALASLCGRNAQPTPKELDAIDVEVHATLRQLPYYRTPELSDATELFDRLAMRGVSFSKALVVFRKMLLTLDGVLNELCGPVDLAPLLARHLGEETLKGLFELNPRHMPLSYSDAGTLALSLLWAGPRLQFGLAQKMVDTLKRWA